MAPPPTLRVKKACPSASKMPDAVSLLKSGLNMNSAARAKSPLYAAYPTSTSRNRNNNGISKLAAFSSPLRTPRPTMPSVSRSEERRVGKKGRWRWQTEQLQEQNKEQ